MKIIERIQDNYRNQIITDINVAASTDSFYETYGYVERDLFKQNDPLDIPVYTEEQFIAIELLGYNHNNVDIETVYSFLKYVGAGARPNTFIYQWAQWRKGTGTRSHTDV